MNQLPAEYLNEEEDKPIDLKYYWYLFQKNFTTILTFFVIAVTLGIIYASKIPDLYTASSQLIFDKITNVVDNTQFVVTDNNYFGTEMEIMRGREVMGQVVRDLRLTDYFGVDNEEDAAVRVAGMVSVSRMTEMSRIVTISVTGSDPQLVAKIATAVARGYIRVNFENSLYYSKEVLNWLPQDGGKPTDTITIQDPDGEVRQVRRSDLIDSLPAFQSDDTLKELRQKKSELEAEIEYQRRQYREKHPILIKSRANLKFIEDTMESQKRRIIEDLKSKAQGEHKLSNARLLEEAKGPGVPVPIKRLQYIIVAGLAELLVSLLMLILIDFFDHTVKSVEDLERKGVVMPFLGHIPFIKSKNNWKSAKDQAVVLNVDESPEIADAFRYIRVAINFSGSPESLKILVVSSCLPHEGKSFISSSLAASLAQDGNKTLLIDGDMRRPVVHKRFKTDNRSGLSNFLTTNIDFESVLKETFVENLTIVTAGPISPNPTEILGSKRMSEFLEEAKKRFDRIIIDCPPMTGIGDALMIGSLVGQLIMVIAAAQTPVDLIKQNQKQLEKARVKVMGTILNMVDMEKERYGGYYKHYHKTYNRYYSEDAKKAQ